MLKTPRTKLTRVPDRGHHDTETLYAILDEALIGHVGVRHQDGHPAVIPTLIARDGDDLLIHGSNASRTVRGAPRRHTRRASRSRTWTGSCSPAARSTTR